MGTFCHSSLSGIRIYTLLLHALHAIQGFCALLHALNSKLQICMLLHACMPSGTPAIYTYVTFTNDVLYIVHPSSLMYCDAIFDHINIKPG